MDEGHEVLGVVIEVDWTEIARTLIAAAIVSDHVEVIESPSQPGKRPAAVERAVHADKGGPGIRDAPFGDGEPSNR
jgi:hypothetical protein